MSTVRRAVQALTLAASAYYALWACAPAVSMRPLNTDMEHPNEIGLAGGYSGEVTGGGGACSTELVACGGGPNGVLWYQHRFHERFSLGGTLFGGTTSIVGGGLLLRGHWVETDRFRLGTDLDGGFLWASLGVPMSVRVVDQLWFYTNPSIGARLVQPVRFPLGVAWGVTENVWIQAEGAYGFDVFTTALPTYSDYWNAYAGASVRF
jgi:hypothetical protein